MAMLNSQMVFFVKVFVKFLNVCWYVFGCFWLVLVVFGCFDLFWLVSIGFGCFWLFFWCWLLVVFGCFWLFLVVFVFDCGCWWWWWWWWWWPRQGTLATTAIMDDRKHTSSCIPLLVGEYLEGAWVQCNHGLLGEIGMEYLRALSLWSSLHLVSPFRRSYS